MVLKLKNDFRDSIKSNINISSNTNIDLDKPEDAENRIPVFKINKKIEEKKNKKAFNVYMDPVLIKELDKASKQTGWSRNEIINKMCDYCIKNIKIE